MPTILLVEDNPDDVVLLQRCIKSQNFNWNLKVARNGAEATMYLQGDGKFADREQFPVPDLVLLDLTLPHVPGHVLLQWIRTVHSNPKLPVIVLTSRGGGSEAALAFRHGCNAYFVKPQDGESLQQVVAEINKRIEEWAIAKR